MRHGRWLAPLMSGVTLASGLSVRAAGHELTFAQRVDAQRAIERVYYSHQVDARIPFERAVPDDLIERKVRDYLLQSAALEQRWGGATGSMIPSPAHATSDTSAMAGSKRRLLERLNGGHHGSPAGPGEAGRRRSMRQNGAGDV